MSDVDGYVQRRRWTHIAAAVLVVGGLAGGGWWLWHSGTLDEILDKHKKRNPQDPDDGLGFTVEVHVGKTRTKRKRCHVDLQLHCPERVEATVEVTGFDKAGDPIAVARAEAAVDGSAWTRVVMDLPCRRFSRFAASAHGVNVR